MNAVLMNRDGFQVPADGFYQIAPLGEFAHAQAGLVQVVDQAACEAMVNRFQEEAKAPNFAGLLVDFDHFSLDGEKRSEAAGWITALESRDGGLFAKIRWSDVGEEAVKGGRYRFLSPVWARSDCADLGNGRVRPLRLLNAAVTNDPNLKGMQPLSNSARTEGEPRFKWVLGDTKDGRHCPSCSRLAGQVHTMAEWDAAGLAPGSDTLCCGGACKCQLEETDEGSRGTLANTGWTNEARQASLEVRRAKALRRAQGGSGDRKDRAMNKQRESLEKASKDYAAIYEQKGIDGMSAEELEYMTARVGQRVRNGSELTPTETRFVQEMRARTGGQEFGKAGGTIVKNRMGGREADGVVANIGWTDAARAASLAVRRAKAALRGGKSGSGQNEDQSAADKAAYDADVREGKQEDASALKAIDPVEGDGATGSTPKVDDGTGVGGGDLEGLFQESGLNGMRTDQIIQFSDQIRDKLDGGSEPLTPAEEGFLDDLSARGGIDPANNGDPLTEWQAHRQQQKQRIKDLTGMEPNAAEAAAEDIQMRLDAGGAVTPEEQAFLEKMKQVIVQNRGDFYGDDAPYIEALVNTGWTDQARVAALAVRRAKSVARGTAGTTDLGGTGRATWVKGTVDGRSVVMPGTGGGTPALPPSQQPSDGSTRRMVQPVVKPGVSDGRVYTGGTPFFDEGTGKRITPGTPTTPAKGTPQPITLPGAPSKSDPLVLKLQTAQAKAKRRV